MTPAIISVLLSLLSTIALGTGAWFFRRLVESTDNLRQEIGSLRESLAADRVQRIQHAAAIAENKTDLKALSDRIRALEMQRA